MAGYLSQSRNRDPQPVTFVRHAETLNLSTADNPEDPPLSEAGIKHARKLRKVLAGRRFRWHTAASSYKRATQQTAHEVGFRFIENDRNLEEIPHSLDDEDLARELSITNSSLRLDAIERGKLILDRRPDADIAFTHAATLAGVIIVAQEMGHYVHLRNTNNLVLPYAGECEIILPYHYIDTDI
jgi:hypothetical protein